MAATEQRSWSDVVNQVKERILAFTDAQFTKNRPHVTLTYAQSLDGSIAGANNEQITLSCDETMDMTHALRACHDCILVGVGTVVNDNPSLTTRRVPGPNPQPVILDPTLRCPLEMKLLKSEDTVRPIIIVADIDAVQWEGGVEPSPREVRELADNIEHRISEVTKQGVKVTKSPATGRIDSEGKCSFCLDWETLIKSLGSSGFKSVMVEGGQYVISKLLHLESRYLESTTSDRDEGPIQALVLTISPLFVLGKGIPFNTIHGGARPPLRLCNPSQRVVGTDVVVAGMFVEEPS